MFLETGLGKLEGYWQWLFMKHFTKFTIDSHLLCSIIFLITSINLYNQLPQH